VGSITTTKEILIVLALEVGRVEGLMLDAAHSVR
jgi:hypothetical protein